MTKKGEILKKKGPVWPAW